jgi:peptide/nickel transport system permease protein
MRQVVEKLFFSLLSLAVASVVTFALLVRIAGGSATGEAPRPLLFNAAPRNVRDLSLALATTVRSGGPGAEAAGRELVRLGAAAFPHLLPLLDALDPTARGRLALALGPVALRMGVAEADDVATPQAAIAFFSHFWQERSADYRGPAVKRKVARLAEQALPLRKKEVMELDTYALPALLGALGHVESPEDVKRIARLSPVLSHVTGVGEEAGTLVSVERARRVVRRYRVFERDHLADFLTLDGPGRLGAMLSHTRYARWVGTAFADASDDPDAAARREHALGTAARSLPLALATLAAAALVAAAVRLVTRRAPRRPDAVRAISLVCAAVPAGLAATGLSALGLGAVLTALTLCLSGMLVLEDGARPSTELAPTEAFRRALGWLPLAVSALLAAEASAGRGLGGLTARALGDGDLTTLMWVALPLAALGVVSANGPAPRPKLSGGSLELCPAERRRARVGVALSSSPSPEAAGSCLACSPAASRAPLRQHSHQAGSWSARSRSRFSPALA